MRKIAFTLLLSAAFFNSCTKDPVEQPAGPVLPETYSFLRNDSSTVDYAGQTARLLMLEELTTYLNSAKNLGTQLDVQKLINMYGNVNNPFSVPYDPTKNLRSKTYAADTTQILNWLNEAAAASSNPVNARPGVAGVINAEYPQPGTATSPGYLVNENGLDYKELIEKGLMGAVFHYQAMEVYLTEDRMNDAGLGNDNLVAGKNYTEMEHYFDEAFGYFGLPTDITNLESDTKKGKFFGKYTISRNIDPNNYSYKDINEKVLDAFIAARAAIVRKDYVARNAALADIVKYWETITGLQAANYLDECFSTKNQPLYKKLHMLTEAIGMMTALNYHFVNGNSKLPRYSDKAKVDEALQIIGLSTNLYNVGDAEIQACLEKLKAAFPAGIIQ